MWYHRYMEKTTLYLDDALRRRLRELSQRLDRPQASLIREALEQYVSSHGRPRPRSIGAGEDGRVGARHVKGWVRDQWAREPGRRDDGAS
jgi:predicted transcriptional regulator